MQIDGSTLVLQSINTLILIWLLGRFLFKPMAQIIAKRQAKAEQLLHDAEAERQAAKAKHEEAQRHLEALAEQRSKALSDASDEAEQLKKTVLVKAQEKAVQRRQDADRKIAIETENVQRKLSEWVNQQASTMVEKLMVRLPEEARINGFITELVNSIAELPDSDRENLINNSEAHLLKCARALTPQESEQLQKTLKQALGHPIRLKFEVVPELIAGFEIDAKHFSIRNNLKADLERLTQSLTPMYRNSA